MGTPLVDGQSAPVAQGKVGRPAPVQRGFPKSLAAGDGDGGLIELLRSRGLTTSMMKTVLAQDWVRKRVGKSAGSREQAITELLQIPQVRADLFLQAARRQSPNPYSRHLSPEYAILEAFSAGWAETALDEPELTAACDAWPAIHDALRSGPFVRADRRTMGAFMLWPKLCAVLADWPRLESGTRTLAGQVAFALSSISGVDWFMRSAINMAPALAVDLEHLCAPAAVAAAGGSPTRHTDGPGTAAGLEDSGGQQPADAVQAEWQALADALDAMADAWLPTPRRGLLEQLAALGRRAADLVPQVPPDRKPATQVLQESLAALTQQLTDVAATPPMDWLVPEMQAQVMARWGMAADDAPDDDECLALADDAAAAAVRLPDAMAALAQAQARAVAAGQTADALEAEMADSSSAMRRLDLAERALLAREAWLADERARTVAMRALLSAVSPGCAAFDPLADYLALRAGEAEQQLADAPAEAHPSGPLDEPAPVAALSVDAPEAPGNASAPDATVDTPPGPPTPSLEHLTVEQASADAHPVDAVQSLGVQPSPGEPAAPGLCETAVETAPQSDCVALMETAEVIPAVGGAPSVPEVVQPLEADAPQPALPDVTATDATLQGDDTVWRLLRMGEAALAFHAASAMHALRPDVPVPPASLLKAVALAPGLTSGDGALAQEMVTVFGEIEAGWFEPGDPVSDDCTALNLLLIAATLRPMVLAPRSGASAIAGYRHLDRRHAALLDLTMGVAELSERLVHFPMGPAVLRSAADEASVRAQLAQLSRAAGDWLSERAPNKKIRYAPASMAWLWMLRPGEPIEALMSAVARGSTAERAAIQKAVDGLSDYDGFLAVLIETDRRKLHRPGPDITGGALDHLWAATREAVDIAQSWLATAAMLTESGDQLRQLVRKLQAVFQAHAAQACLQLAQPWEGDAKGRVGAASALLMTELRAVSAMFEGSDAVPSAEPLPGEQIARDLLRVPGAAVGPGWVIESGAGPLLAELAAWSHAPVGVEQALAARLEGGDVAGAELLLPWLADDQSRSVQAQVLERTREQWQRDQQALLLRVRRATEVGLAYGYLTYDERASRESELSALEIGMRESGRFDVGARQLHGMLAWIEDCKAQRVQKARKDFERERPRLTQDVADQVEAPLTKSDIHTFNELLQRVRQGVDPWPERALHRDAFREFFPQTQAALHDMLAGSQPADIERLIGAGGRIGSVSFDLDGDLRARQSAERTWRTWAAAVSRHAMPDDSLRNILEAVGLTATSLTQEKANAQGLRRWSLQTPALDDREICPVPHFGSRAQGLYRVVCLWDRLTPEDFLHRTGEDTQQRATLVLSLGRSPQRLWAELARVSKERQRSFLLLDETMLLFLLAQQGSRLAAWFSIALPFTYSEPYDASAGYVPPEMFYGRTSELESVRTQDGCFFIYGGRQLGKTALLRRAEKTFHDPASDRYAIWIDLLAQGIGERRRASELWMSIAEKLRELKVGGMEWPAVHPAKPASVDGLLLAVKTFLAARPGRRILLLLDEADRFFEQDGRQESAYAETRRLKQLMDETQRRFKVVFAGLHNVLRTVSTSNQPLGHFNEAVRIGPLMDEREIRAAEELITRPIEAAGFEFEDRSLVMRILAQTNYYPSLIQVYCTQLLRHMRDKARLRRQESTGPRFRIEEADIESVFAGSPLRDAIRSKFRLTLQLDPRYEVIAHAIGLEALAEGYDHAAGIDWKKIRLDCATLWWPEGFASTVEHDFLMLLDEMVHLGVLSRSGVADHFSLRNPNVLLLLGSKQEIEKTLQAEREPRVEFESTIFRPALAGRADRPARNPLTYRQLDEVMQLRNSVLILAASDAAGGGHLLAGLHNQPGLANTRSFVAIDAVRDRQAFGQTLDREVRQRESEGLTLMFVPAQVPWDGEWVATARTKLNALTSKSSFVTVVFAADPARLWALADDAGLQVQPWLSVLPWPRGFVRKWLEDLQLTADTAVDRLAPLTGYWGGLLESAASVKGGALDFSSNLTTMEAAQHNPDWKRQNRMRLMGSNDAAERVLAEICNLGDGVTIDDLVEFGELPRPLVERTLRWAEPLGLAIRLPGGYWALDAFVKLVLEQAKT